MTPLLPRRRALKFGLAGVLGVAGLPARACEFWTPTLRITHPWTRATADGETTAVVSMKFDAVQIDDRLVGAETPVAGSIELAGRGVGPELDFAILKGQECHLSEAGPHMRLMELTQPLEIGRAYPLRLVFAAGGAVITDLSVDYERFR